MSRPARIFGVTTNLSGGLGDGMIANSFTKNTTTEVAEARDEFGGLLDLAPYSKNEELSIEGLFTSTGPQVGTKITIGTKDYLISQVSKTESNTDFQKCSVSARGGDDFTVIHELSSIQQSE